MKTIQIQPASSQELEFLTTLLRRMQISFSVDEKLSSAMKPTVDDVFGSWSSEESGDELVKMIYGARNDAPRDVEL